MGSERGEAQASTGEGLLTYVAPNLDPATDRAVLEALGSVDDDFGVELRGTVASDAQGPWLDEVSPLDTRIGIARHLDASANLVADVVRRGSDAAIGWGRLHWSERVTQIRLASQQIAAERPRLAALLMLELGKIRIEAVGEVNEAIAFADYYCEQIERSGGFEVTPQSSLDQYGTRDVLRPYGLWAVIGPFNFPVALTAGPAIAALISGNAVIVKPAIGGGLAAIRVLEAIRSVLPPDVLQIVTGSSTAGGALIDHPEVGGITFTGSHAIGMSILERCARQGPKPAICEMGGKNPTIVMPSADLDEAVAGVAQAAFSFAGQKCSSNSRLLVHDDVAQPFLDALVERTASLVVGDPRDREAALGPLIDRGGVSRYSDAVEEARRHGDVLIGGKKLVAGDLANGHYVEPTIVEGDPSLRAWQDELFCPILSVMRVSTIREAMARANDTPLGLTAGIFSTDPDEIDLFLHEIYAGVANVNRRAGATTGGWPGLQPFGGWKGSGSTGKLSGGPHYLPLYMREQAQTVVHG